MTRVNTLDAAWLYMESVESPMHVASLQIFSLPKGAAPDYVTRMVSKLKSTKKLAPPWNRKLQSSLLSRLLPQWTVDDTPDMDYHVRHSALPRPGGERELGVLVSRLHSHQLDLKRPLWECHFIEGLRGNRYALYIKMHHSLIDGVSGMRLLQRQLSDDPSTRNMLAPWAAAREPAKKGGSDIPSFANALSGLVDALREQASSLPQLGMALGRLVRAATAAGSKLTAPFSTPKSVFNGRITGQRRFATQQYDLTRLKNLSAAIGCSLNDVVLAICSGAMRRFLIEHDALPGKPLTAGIPVNVRPADDTSTGTAISFIFANLATDVESVRERIAAIQDSTQRAKDHLQQLPRNSLTQYTLAVMGTHILQILSGLGGRVRPVFNITISNVPGPDKPLYFNGAKLEAMYPMSLLSHGQALNITCMSYAGTMNFGFTGCRDTLPHMQHLAIYAGQALEALEAEFLPKPGRKVKDASAKAAATARKAAGAKPRPRRKP
jgi:diacylglycerol O-acyltransferase / wax synthase